VGGRALQKQIEYRRVLVREIKNGTREPTGMHLGSGKEPVRGRVADEESSDLKKKWGEVKRVVPQQTMVESR